MLDRLEHRSLGGVERDDVAGVQLAVANLADTRERVTAAPLAHVSLFGP
jgi:hypothetical protein